MTPSPVSMCGVNSALCLPRRSEATRVASRPNTIPSASITNQPRFRFSAFGKNVFIDIALQTSQHILSRRVERVNNVSLVFLVYLVYLFYLQNNDSSGLLTPSGRNMRIYVYYFSIIRRHLGLRITRQTCIREH